MSGTKKKSRLRSSKNKKVYWRKGARIDDVEDFLHTQRVDEREGGILSERKDEELFTIDTTGTEEVPKLTKRQQAAQRKRQLAAEDDVPEEMKPSKRFLKRTFPKKSKNVPSRLNSSSVAVPSSATKEPRDLWAGEEAEIVVTGQEHYERTTKKKLPRKPDTLKHVPTLLPSVDVAQPGASYNPALLNYQSYVKEIGDEQLDFEKREEKLKRNLELPPGESYVTESERWVEESAGLFDDAVSKDVEEQLSPEKDESSAGVEPTEHVSNKRKTRKEILQKASQRKKELQEKKRKSVADVEQTVYATRKLNKEISKVLAEQEESKKLRKKNKAVKKLLGRQQLGRGKFEDVDKPFLLTDELPGSLRQLKPQGDILGERLKSFQKRNMLPIAGERNKPYLKKRLKFKEIQRRSHQGVTLGSHLKC